MIGQLTGTLLQKTPPQIVLDCHGVGYEVDVSMHTFYNLPALGDSVTLLTHMAVRDDAHLLFGFNSAEERNAFRQLIKISGVGARTALAVLSGLTVTDLVHAITQQDSSRFIKVPGIGKKTAERLLLELKGKLGVETDGSTLNTPQEDNQNDILQALLALGYSEKEAANTLKSVPPDMEVSAGIKWALQALAK